MKKRTETISETKSILIVKKTSAGSTIGWCLECDGEVVWIASAELNLFGVGNLPERVAIHKRGGNICSRSLINEIRNGETI